MIIYKDILEKLKAAGYSSYRLVKEGHCSPATVQKIREQKTISMDTLDMICRLTGLNVESIIEYVPNTTNDAKD